MFALVREYIDVRNFIFCIQSDKESTNHCKVQTYKFLEQYKAILEEMSEEKFDKIRAGCVARVTEKEKNLNEKFGNDLDEVLSHSYRWNRKQLQEESLRALTKQQVLDFFNRIFFESPHTLEFHQYAPARREEGVEFRNQRVLSEGVVFVNSNAELKSVCDRFPDVEAVIP